MIAVFLLCTLVMVAAFLMAWVLAGGLLMGTLVSRGPVSLEKILNYKGKNCACRFPFRCDHTAAPAKHV
ncbi:MAG TPA: hypothetical protein VJ732_10505 [Bryobacteraceae bacterium]|nr:hypothetical protein [Bryobacteraceae bacterium]